MNSLNYHHLRYFWAVATFGGVGEAASALHVTQPTVSGQLKLLEEDLGVRLFNRQGRRLVLTNQGEMVLRYANSIFEVGDELLDELSRRQHGHNRRFVVGVADGLPKMASVIMLEPALSDPSVRLIVKQDSPDSLLADLENRLIDAVISDSPATPTKAARAISRLLGESPIGLYGSPDLARIWRPKFPHDLDGAPFLMPLKESSLRREVDKWFRSTGIKPDVVAEFDDSGMMKAFGRDGFGIFPAPTVVGKAICSQYSVETVGVPEGILETFYLITLAHSDEEATRSIQRVAIESLFSNA